jgi:nitroreductase
MEPTIKGTRGVLPKDLQAAIESRRSVRKFRPEPVPRELLMQVIAAGVQAPSACNIQGWRFILVEKPELRRTLHEAGGSVLIPASPSGILIVYDNTTKNTPYRDDVQSAAACIQNMLLAAQGFGLGACWICNLPSPSFLRRLLGIPWNYSPVAYMILGYPVDGPRQGLPRRHRLEHIVGLDAFPAAEKGETPGRVMVPLLRLAYWGYRTTPRWLKKLALNRFVDQKLTKKFDN